MVFPILSVTLIGLIGAAACTAMRTQTPSSAFMRGLIGAWGGFAAGALLGVLIDVVAQTGIWVGVIGHLAAVAGTIWTIRIRPQKSRIRQT